MKIAVCVKQVPASQDAKMDPERGTLIRDGAVATNPYDLFAVEAALRIREQTGGEVTAFSMGPQSAEKTLRDAIAMGADHGVLISDRAFAGADVLATSYTLSQAIAAKGPFDLIVFGRQTTDGDTAQGGPAVAVHLGRPYLCWIQELIGCSEEEIRVRCSGSRGDLECGIRPPCVICVDKGIGQPRIPALKAKLAAKKAPLECLSAADLPDQDPMHYGLEGSATRVEKIYPPYRGEKGFRLQGSMEENADRVSRWLSLAANGEYEGIRWEESM